MQAHVWTRFAAFVIVILLFGSVWGDEVLPADKRNRITVLYSCYHYYARQAATTEPKTSSTSRHTANMYLVRATSELIAETRDNSVEQITALAGQLGRDAKEQLTKLPAEGNTESGSGDRSTEKRFIENCTKAIARSM